MARNGSRLVMCLLGIVIGASCQSKPESADDEPDSPVLVTSTLPELAEESLPSNMKLSPNRVSDPIAVSENGGIAVIEGDGAAMIRIADGVGMMPHTVGKPGQGPGELSAPVLLTLTPTTVSLFDMSQNKLVTLSVPDGKVQRERRLTTVSIPADDAGSRGLLVRTIGGSGITPALIDDRGALTTLIPPGDTAYHKLLNGDDLSVKPSVGLWTGGFIVANGSLYRIALYDWTGHALRTLSRNLDPMKMTANQIEADLQSLVSYRGPNGERTDEATLANRRRELESKVVPHFSHQSPLRSDAQGRIWVLGTEGDSAYADVFTPEAFLGRISLGCTNFGGRWALAGKWLAVVCEASPTDDEVIVRRYKISDKP